MSVHTRKMLQRRKKDFVFGVVLRWPIEDATYIFISRDKKRVYREINRKYRAINPNYRAIIPNLSRDKLRIIYRAIILNLSRDNLNLSRNKLFLSRDIKM